MNQPRRPPTPSPADRQIQALEDVERIARAWEDAHGRLGIRAAVTELLHRDIIRVGHRPKVERPLEGQMTIDEQAAHDRREALDDARRDDD